MHSSILRRIWFNFMAQYLFLFRLLYSFYNFFSRISNFFGLSTTEETYVVEMRIWCIKISIELFYIKRNKFICFVCRCLDFCPTKKDVGNFALCATRTDAIFRHFFRIDTSIDKHTNKQAKQKWLSKSKYWILGIYYSVSVCLGGGVILSSLFIFFFK
jgi:hypothetical protein